MTINDIMMRDLQEEDRKQRERAEHETRDEGNDCGLPWLAIAVWIAAGLAALCAAFAGGMYYQSRRDLKADRDFTAWCDRVERAATERARAMSNYELLQTERVRATAN